MNNVILAAPPAPHLLPVESLIPEQPAPRSRLGDILTSSPRKLRTLTEWLTDVYELFVPQPAWTTPTFEVADYLPAPLEGTLTTRRVKQNFCPNCTERTTITTLKGVQITVDRPKGMYTTNEHDCGTHLVNGDELLPTMTFAEVGAKNAAMVKEAQRFQHSARKYWQFCVAFEFPKVYDREAAEKSKQQLAREVPADHLTALEKTFESRCLLNPDRLHLSFCDGVSSHPSQRHMQRRYALGKRGDAKDDLTFVRQQDSALAMGL